MIIEPLGLSWLEMNRVKENNYKWTNGLLKVNSTSMPIMLLGHLIPIFFGTESYNTLRLAELVQSFF